MNATLCRALEHYRLTHPPKKASFNDLSERVVYLWIHHDNMLEGHLFGANEIREALEKPDSEINPYNLPSAKRIRAYRQLLEWIFKEARKGINAVSQENLKAIHLQLTPAARDMGGIYRPDSPVHRDYSQTICPPQEVEPRLTELLQSLEKSSKDFPDPADFLAEFHFKLMGIYPFRRNPGTTARLFTNLLSLSLGFPPIVLPGQERSEYFTALEQPNHKALAALFESAFSAYLEEIGESTN